MRTYAIVTICRQVGGNMRILATLLAGFLLIGASECIAADESVIGSVKSVKGTVSILRAGYELPAWLGQTLYEKDTLRTGKNGSIGVILRDDTVISLGPDSQLSIDEFVFEPQKGQLALVTKMIRGVASFITGQIAKLAPQSARFETPVANIGVRGTRFLIKVEE